VKRIPVALHREKKERNTSRMVTSKGKNGGKAAISDGLKKLFAREGGRLYDPLMKRSGHKHLQKETILIFIRKAEGGGGGAQ